MICDSQCFEFSQLNSLLSWAFSWQDKKIKINENINASSKFQQFESYNTELCYVLFFVMILSILFKIKPINLKKSYSHISKKQEQVSINLTNAFDFID